MTEAAAIALYTAEASCTVALSLVFGVKLVGDAISGL